MKNIKPSELVRLGLHDLEKIESMPEYGVNMGTWHRAMGKCWVCFAGAVMAITLKAPITNLMPESFPEQKHLLMALNYFRAGDIRFALTHMGIPLPDGLPEVMHVPAYERGRDEFKAAMLVMAHCMERHGL